MDVTIWLDCAVFLRPLQHSIGFYGSKDPTNSIKVLKENPQKTWLKNWYALISASGTTNNVSKRKHDYYRQSSNVKEAKLM